MKHLSSAVGLVLAISAHLAQALPVTTNSPSGHAGTDVTVVLSDGAPSGLFGASVIVVYDSTILTFRGGTPGTIQGAISLNPLDPPPVSLIGADPLDLFFFLDTTNPNAYSFTASLAYPFPFGANAAPGSLMNLLFGINSAALPGTSTTVDFSCDDFGGAGCLDYEFPPVSATVTVLPANAAPLPGTLPLLGLGMAALIWARRRP